jgi:hypothetical protein
MKILNFTEHRPGRRGVKSENYVNYVKNKESILKKNHEQAWWRQGPRMCDGFEVGSYGCGTCSLAPVGFWEKMPILAKKS